MIGIFVPYIYLLINYNMKKRFSKQMDKGGMVLKTAFALCLFLLMGIPAWAGWADTESHDTITLDDFKYRIDKKDKTAILLGLEKEMTSIGIPTNIEYKNETYKLVALGERCFLGHTSLKAVNIPSTILSIGESCFAGCTALETAYIPSSVENIGRSCFNGCTSLKEVVLSDKIQYLRENCFNNCKSLVSICIPGSVKWIGEFCFSRCERLVYVEVLQKDSYYLGEGALYGCKNLRAFVSYAKTPPVRLEHDDHIPYDQFGLRSDCPKLQVYVPEEFISDYQNSQLFNNESVFEVLCVDGFDDFMEGVWEDIDEGLTLNNDGSYTYNGLYYGLDEVAGTVSVTGVFNTYYYDMISPSIGDGVIAVSEIFVPEMVSYKGKTYIVTSLADGCFKGYLYLRKVILPSTIKTIGNECFIGTGVESLSLPDELESIGNRCFQESALGSIDIPATVKYIGDRCFDEAAYLKKIVLRSKDLDYLGVGCFNAFNLESFVCYSTSVPQFEHIDNLGNTVSPFSDNISMIGKLYVHEDLIDAYKASEDWSGWMEILPISSFDSTTGIESIKVTNGNGAFYDLQGRKVITPQKSGIYIKNGKKFVVY
jgi:hypothetical protein